MQLYAVMWHLNLLYFNLNNVYKQPSTNSVLSFPVELYENA